VASRQATLSIDLAEWDAPFIRMCAVSLIPLCIGPFSWRHSRLGQCFWEADESYGRYHAEG
jgi:hypothetical protein